MLLLLLSLFLSLPPSLSYHILFVGTDLISHFHSTMGIALLLSNHTITYIAHGKVDKIYKKENLEKRFPKVKYVSLGNFTFLNAKSIEIMQQSRYSYFAIAEFVECSRSYVVNNAIKIHDVIRDSKPDVVIGDMMVRGVWAVPATLYKIPHISFTAFPYTERFGDNLVWQPPPNVAWSVKYGGDLLYRVQNILTSTISRLLVESKFETMHYLTQNILNIPYSPSVPHSKITLSFFGFEDAMYLPPYVYLSGSTRNLADVGELTLEWSEFLDKAETDGLPVIIISIGSFCIISPDMVAHMVSVINQVEYARFIWSLNGESQKRAVEELKPLKSHCKVHAFIPQLTLLANKNVKLFVTHGGYGSIGESLYHHVPVICFPQVLDQPHNCARAKDRGIGETIDHVTDLTADLIKKVLVTDSEFYQRNVKRVSGIMRATATREKLASFIENIAEFGDQHLFPQVLYLPLWQQWNLDIIGLVIITTLLLFYILYSIIHCIFCCKCFCRSKKHSPKLKTY